MLLTELNTDVLLHVYGYLDLIDSINLAETCTRFRDVGQVYYKRFETFNLEHYLRVFRCYKRHNRIDATIVLKHIGPLIRNLEANLDANEIGSDVSTSIRKYCVNVNALKIIEGSLKPSHNPFTASLEPSYNMFTVSLEPSYNPFTASLKPSYNPFTEYSEWLRKLILTKISLSCRDLFLIDLSERTTLDELHIHCHDLCFVQFDYGLVADIFERNCNISFLRIPLTDGFQFNIFEKLKCLKSLRLDIKYSGSEGHLEKVAANLKMTALEKLELEIASWLYRVDGLNEFLQGLSKKALHLKDLSINNLGFAWNTNILPSIRLLNLTSLHVEIKYPNLYVEIPKVQPNLTHLDLTIYDDETKPMEQIIFLINNLKKLELLRLRNLSGWRLQAALKDFLQESVLYQIFDCRFINRPTVILQLFDLFELEVELDFEARKWMFKITNSHIDLVEPESSIPFYYAKCFSGTVADLDSVKSEAIQWIKGLL